MTAVGLSSVRMVHQRKYIKVKGRLELQQWGTSEPYLKQEMFSSCTCGRGVSMSLKRPPIQELSVWTSRAYEHGRLGWKPSHAWSCHSGRKDDNASCIYSEDNLRARYCVHCEGQESPSDASAMLSSKEIFGINVVVQQLCLAHVCP